MATDGTGPRALPAVGRGVASGLATVLVLLALSGLFGWPVRTAGVAPSRPAVVAAVGVGVAVAALVVALTVAERAVE